MEAERYTHELALSLRDDWQFSRIFSSAEARPGFTALLALRVEMQNLLAQSSEPGIAVVKFEWWRNEIEQGFAGKAQHPLAHALGEYLSRAGSAPEYCLELVDAAETELESVLPFTEQDFQLYLYRSGGVLAEQLALLSDCKRRDALNAARQLGRVKRLNELLWSAGAMLRAGRWLFPEEWLETHGLTVQDVLLDVSDTRVRKLQRTMLDVLDHERIQARTAMEGVALPPALVLQWSLAQKDHARLVRQPARMFSSQSGRSSGFSRLWTAWRSARRAIRKQ